ncbi:MAG: amidohydrolase [Clostridia bacterium]|nr:amidohydrolase [Clostridia bacterium]
MHTDIIAIDIHSHLNHGSPFDGASELWENIHLADYEHLKKMSDSAEIDKTFYSTYASLYSTSEIEKENEYMQNLSNEKEDVYFWAVIDPRNDKTFEQANKMLGKRKCAGIKLHPPMHKYKLEEYGDKIFSFASDHKAIVLIHPEKDADYILPFADKYADVTFIMAHMDKMDYKRALEGSLHGNVYTDTSGSLSSLNNVIEYYVNYFGSDKILFGTDTYAAGFQRGRIEYALINEEDKKKILRYNAEKLFSKIL